jgi:hypothetical protein
MKIFIIAPRFEQFEQFQHYVLYSGTEQNLRRDARFVREEHDMHGYNDTNATVIVLNMHMLNVRQMMFVEIASLRFKTIKYERT